YHTQIEDLLQRQERKEKEHQEEIEKLKWEAQAELQVKDIQLDAQKRDA
ncbi:hypothetical protein HA385_23525, partial [Escherichia coli]|nr:hypothetical protein [Escherichia coli]